MLQENSLQYVTQIAFEAHIFPDRQYVDTMATVAYYKQLYRTLESLRLNGFWKWSSRENEFTKYRSKTTNKDRNFCWEMVYVNENKIN